MASGPPYLEFYRTTLRSLLDAGQIDRRNRVLVVCGGPSDLRVLKELEFLDVTIANLDSRMTSEAFAPFNWSFQDAEALTFEDGSFDIGLVCAGLHHCKSPHRALLELYRVARRCVVAIEARDGLLSRIATRLGVVDEFEVTAVAGNDYRFGGLRNTTVPNYIYRWTEREVVKTVLSAEPFAWPRFLWFHAFDPPLEVLRARRSLRALMILYIAFPALWLLTKVFRGQCNLFGFAILKPDLKKELFPWLVLRDGEPVINRPWAEARFSIPNPVRTEPR